MFWIFVNAIGILLIVEDNITSYTDLNPHISCAIFRRAGDSRGDMMTAGTVLLNTSLDCVTFSQSFSIKNPGKRKRLVFPSNYNKTILPVGMHLTSELYQRECVFACHSPLPNRSRPACEPYRSTGPAPRCPSEPIWRRELETFLVPKSLLPKGDIKTFKYLLLY